MVQQYLECPAQTQGTEQWEAFLKESPNKPPPPHISPAQVKGLSCHKSPRQFVDATNKVDSIDREQLEDITCRETPPELQASTVLKLFNKFLSLRPGERVQSSWLTSSIIIPPLPWELCRWGLLEVFLSGTWR